MIASVSYLDLALYFFLYAFLGWVAEVVYYFVLYRRFCNRGFLTQPLLLSYGATFAVLIVVLPTLEGSPVFQFLFILMASSVSESLFQVLRQRAGRWLRWEPERHRLFTGRWQGVLYSLLISAVYYAVYLLVHPFVLLLVGLLPSLAKKIIVGVWTLLLLGDFAMMRYALRKGLPQLYLREQERGGQKTIGTRLTDLVWRRLRKAYPNLQRSPEGEDEKLTFAKGVCVHKLLWVFLVSALIGDGIETLYCGFVGGNWMNRSSVLYGPFSFVWGFGAVLLTVTLRRLADKQDRHVFFAGFFVGGAYEYLCSVFTEAVFGTVFWDYSQMPLNIDGRTNVLYCCFWGVLAVVWIKGLYPLLSKGIERIPPLAGVIATWVIVFLMVCNTFLTCAAMVRYAERTVSPEASNFFEEFLDEQYDDAYMEEHWQNMKLAG